MGKGPSSDYEYRAAEIVKASEIAQGMKKSTRLQDVINERHELQGKVVYYRISNPKSERGQAQIKFLTQTMNYKPCTNGEAFVHMPGGTLFWAWKEQHKENMQALKMVGKSVKNDLARRTKRSTSDALGYAFGAQEVHTEASVREVNLGELVNK